MGVLARKLEHQPGPIHMKHDARMPDVRRLDPIDHLAAGEPRFDKLQASVDKFQDGGATAASVHRFRSATMRIETQSLACRGAQAISTNDFKLLGIDRQKRRLPRAERIHLPANAPIERASETRPKAACPARPFAGSHRATCRNRRHVIMPIRGFRGDDDIGRLASRPTNWLGRNDHRPAEDCIVLAYELGPTHGIIRIDFECIILQLPGKHPIAGPPERAALERVRVVAAGSETTARNAPHRQSARGWAAPASCTTLKPQLARNCSDSPFH